jgi:hypothetical protein
VGEVVIETQPQAESLKSRKKGSLNRDDVGLVLLAIPICAFSALTYFHVTVARSPHPVLVVLFWGLFTGFAGHKLLTLDSE